MRLKPLLVTLAVTGAIAGGGAAIASAATSSTSTKGSSPATAPHSSTAPGRSSRNCPNMGAGNGASTNGSSAAPSV